MLGSTPPWAIVTPASNLFNSSSFLRCNFPEENKQKKSNKTVPDGKLQVPGDDARLLVVPRSISGQLQDLCSQVLHHCRHIDGSSCANSLGVVTFPEKSVRCMHPNPTHLSSLWILPTGNWRPALLDLDLAFPFTLPPFPRPDMVCNRGY